MDQWNDELKSLFESYRAATPDPEPSANFMPELWRKIESRQSIMLRVRKVSQIFLAAAAALCIVFATILSIPAGSRPDSRGSYVDVLADAYPTESLAAHGIIPRDNPEANTK